MMMKCTQEREGGEGGGGASSNVTEGNTEVMNTSTPPATTTPRPQLMPVPDALMLTLRMTRSIITSGASVTEQVDALCATSVLGRTLAEDVESPVDVPAYRASIKDGYALRACGGAGETNEDGERGIVLRVAGSARAGEQTQTALDDASCVYITTGGALPEGTDAVVMVEDVTLEDGGAMLRVPTDVYKKITPGTDVRQVGSDTKKGEVVLKRGTVVCESAMGLFASLGVTNVNVFALPTVAILSTGDELVDAKSQGELQAGFVRDANRVMLRAMVARVLGANAATHIVDHGIVRDDVQTTAARFRTMIDSGVDVLVCSGGVSMGDADCIKPALRLLGATIHIERILMKPGKPLTFATLRIGDKSMLVFGLPGNPASSAVTFNLFVRPTLEELCTGNTGPDEDMHTPRVTAVLAQRLRLDPVRPEYHRVTLEWRHTALGGEWCAHSTGRQISSRIASMVGADALLELPKGDGFVEAGTKLPCVLIGGWPQMRRSRCDAPGTEIVVVGDEPTPATRAIDSESKPQEASSSQVRIGVLTVSDRASAGVYEDLSGPAIQKYLTRVVSVPFRFDVRLVADERALIEAELCTLCDDMGCDLVVTTGGTGPAPRDVTPEATVAVCDKVLDGFGEAMRAASLAFVPTAILSRQVAGTRGSSLIINCPGKPKAIGECLDAVMPAVPYCIDLVGGRRLEFHESECRAFRPKSK